MIECFPEDPMSYVTEHDRILSGGSHVLYHRIIDIARHCLKLSGTVLNVSVLLDKKKFRSYVHKEGALKGFRLFQDDDLGTLDEFSGRGNSEIFLSQHACVCY